MSESSLASVLSEVRADVRALAARFDEGQRRQDEAAKVSHDDHLRAITQQAAALAQTARVISARQDAIERKLDALARQIDERRGAEKVARWLIGVITGVVSAIGVYWLTSGRS